jgi:hypothetical protein
VISAWMRESRSVDTTIYHLRAVTYNRYRAVHREDVFAQRWPRLPQHDDQPVDGRPTFLTRNPPLVHFQASTCVANARTTAAINLVISAWPLLVSS